jgi:hypothetical protein
MKAQEDSRPALCWTFLSAGVRLCLLLGYHRREVLEVDPPQLADSKRRLFWLFYMMDKILSLSLGRVSNFPDYDIDALMFTVSEDPECRSWDEMYVVCIELAKIMGKIYDELYSTNGRKKPPELKSRTVEELASSLTNCHGRFKKAGRSPQNCNSV